MSWLSPSTDGSATAPPNLTPDALANKLTPMLGLSKETKKILITIVSYYWL